MSTAEDRAQEAREERARAHRCPCVGTNDPRCSYPDCGEGDDDD